MSNQDDAHTDDELPASFTDERGREWHIRLSIPVVHQYCREHRLRLGELTPAHLDMGQLVDLAYAGTRYQARAQADPEPQDAWMESLDGPSFLACQEAAAHAVINFTLRTSVEKSARAGVAASIKADMETARQAVLATVGGGNTSSS